jgi:hypothetical protein
MLDTDARHRDLLFLLGLAPLALGCAVGVSDDGPQFTSSYPGTPPGDDESAEDETTAGSGEGSAGDGATGQADDDASASASASVSVSAGDDGSTSGGSASASASVSVSVSASMDDGMTSYDYTSGMPPPGGTPCEGYGYVIAACYYGGDPMAASTYATNCENGISYFAMYFGPACAVAFEESRACISQLSCQELMMYGAGVCDMEEAAFQAACA